MTLKASFDRITIEPGKLGGKPCIRGMRMSVEDVLDYLAFYPAHADVLAAFPYLGRRGSPASPRLRCGHSETSQQTPSGRIVKLLIDQNVTPEVAALLRELGHEAIHRSELSKQTEEGPDLIVFARESNMVVVTRDRDFH